MADKGKDEPLFTVPLPGGRVARVPLSVLEAHVDKGARACHGAGTAPRPPKDHGAAVHVLGNPAGSAPGVDGSDPTTTTVRAGKSMITINIYTQGSSQVVAEEVLAQPVAPTDDDDVIAHSMSVDLATGSSDWHTDWEFGECDYTDDSGMPHRIQAWHRHPFGTEYTEIYEGS